MVLQAVIMAKVMVLGCILLKNLLKVNLMGTFLLKTINMVLNLRLSFHSLVNDLSDQPVQL